MHVRGKDENQKIFLPSGVTALKPTWTLCHAARRCIHKRQFRLQHHQPSPHGRHQVPLGSLPANSSVTASFMLKCTYGFWNNMVPSRWRPRLFQQDDEATFCSLTPVWLQSKGVQVPDWPACGPDLSPIKHVQHYESKVRKNPDCRCKNTFVLYSVTFYIVFLTFEELVLYVSCHSEEVVFWNREVFEESNN